MGLLTILRKQKEKEKQMRILILGLDNSGKTTILSRISGLDHLKVQPTLGFNIRTLLFQQYQLSFWDIGGQSCIRSYWRNYFESTDGLVFVVDSSDPDRLLLAKKELHMLLQQERLQGASLLVYANKQDVPGCVDLQEIIDLLGLHDIQSHHWSIQKCSAMSGLNLLDGMEWLVNDIAGRLFSVE